MFCVLLKLTPVFIFAMPGVIALALYPRLERPKTTFITLMNELLPGGVRGLVLAALVCALISSLDADDELGLDVVRPRFRAAFSAADKRTGPGLHRPLGDRGLHGVGRGRGLFGL